MSEMVERMARAIAATDNDLSNWREWLPHARAAIEVMREPDDEMKIQGARGWRRGQGATRLEPAVTELYQLMIDAASARDKGTKSA